MKQKTQGRELSTLVPASFVFSDYDEYAVISYSFTLVRLAICIGCPTHAGISPAPFHSYIAVIPNTYAFSSA